MYLRDDDEGGMGEELVEVHVDCGGTRWVPYRSGHLTITGNAGGATKR